MTYEDDNEAFLVTDEGEQGGIETIFQSKHLARVIPQLRTMQRNSIPIHLRLVENEEDLPIGISKLGGSPDLPPAIRWPTGQLHIPPPSPAFLQAYPQFPLLPPDGIISLPFIAQIRLSDLQTCDIEGLLPSSGMLYFFYNAIVYASDGTGTGAIHDNQTNISYDYYDYRSPANWQVLYYNDDLSTLKRVALPPSIPSEAHYQTSTLAFSREPTLPSVETSFIGDRGSSRSTLVLTEEEWREYESLHSHWRHGRALPHRHHLLGYSDDAQPYMMENAYRGIRKRIFPELTVPLDQLSLTQQQQEFTTGRLLLQIGGEDNNNMWFGRGGYLYFFIKEQNLANYDFSRVWINEA